MVALHQYNDGVLPGQPVLDIQLVSKAMEKFLEHGANPSLWLSAIPRGAPIPKGDDDDNDYDEGEDQN